MKNIKTYNLFLEGIVDDRLREIEIEHLNNNKLDNKDLNLALILKSMEFSEEKYSKNKTSALSWSASRGNLNYIRSLIEDYDVDPCYNKHEPLLKAIKNNKQDAVNLLLHYVSKKHKITFNDLVGIFKKWLLEKSKYQKYKGLYDIFSNMDLNDIINEDVSEPYENIMKTMVDNDEIDVNNVENIEKDIDKIKEQIEQKKVELEKKLENLENLEVETFTEENKDIVEKKKEEIGKSIEDIKEQIAKYQENIDSLKDSIAKLKE